MAHTPAGVGQVAVAGEQAPGREERPGVAGGAGARAIVLDGLLVEVADEAARGHLPVVLGLSLVVGQLLASGVDQLA
jgi:hypothetical protein